MSTTEIVELPPLPANEKTYAGIPEAVFVVSSSHPFRKCAMANLKNPLKKQRQKKNKKKRKSL